ncbi:heavy metal translocating P-type ATPase [Paracraurococcus lichenis]|uniref:Heavy metal translocating P-type ATPase n=1 Tax=Paracraurococcus lichenis TaxID=3064888 RepID=A0ABT9E541_9PROT|nr:heavy metal translocating P-type ATPase [Paracraurococcus sp. LOR1-02]MDO9711287.1 heavy metal translocating P-type ATPase [Paracraurococcus sp. LOR1-02]
MSEAARLAPEAASGCAHCGAPVPAGARFCCPGCEGAHDLVAGLGLDAFYRRREAADGSLRPAVEAPALDFTMHVRGEGEEKTLELIVAGLTCGACVWLVEQALAAEPEVTRARVALSTRRLMLSWRGEAARANDFVALLARLGFRVAPWSPACLRATEDAEGKQLVRSLGIAAFGAMNVMMLSVAVWVGWDMGEATRAGMHWAAALIGLPTVLVAGLPIYRNAVAGLRMGRLNMDMAVSLGVLATTVMSASETLRNGDYTYFDAATSLLALLLAGRVLDRAARRRARQAVAELLALQEGAVTRLDADGTAQAAPAANLRAGDRILVAAGERLRLDAVLEAGEALLDASATSGESLPRGFVAGEALPAGAVNMGAPFIARVTAAAADGSLAAMARLLERAEQAKGRFVDIADRAVRVFVPVVHAVAALTFLGWWLGMGVSWQEALVPAVAALIVTCPCGFAIAVPAVQAVAVGALFRRGVLVANGTALERLASADHAVLDKTGTLTEGRPTLLPGDWAESELREAAGLARASRHPLAKALAAACPEAPAVEGLREVPGRGLVAGERRLGSAAFLGLAGADAGLTLWYAVPGRAPVAFRFADRLREDAPRMVAALRGLGLSAELLSGDAPPAVAAVARQAGIARWSAQVTPEAKAARIEALRAEGRRTLMVGDGINDAAALALAHVSACPGDGTDLAQTAADLVLRAEGLSTLPSAIRTARRAQRLAQQNIAFSLAYNLVAVPLAILGVVTPLLAALVMASSSLIVIGNSLRAGKDPAWTA